MTTHDGNLGGRQPKEYQLHEAKTTGYKKRPYTSDCLQVLLVSCKGPKTVATQPTWLSSDSFHTEVNVRVTFCFPERHSWSVDRSSDAWEMTSKVSDFSLGFECRDGLLAHGDGWTCDQGFAWEENETVLADELILWDENTEMND